MRSFTFFVNLWLVVACVLTFGNEETIHVERNLGAAGNTDIPTTSAVNTEEKTIKIEENGREKAFTVEELKAMSVNLLLGGSLCLCASDLLIILFSSSLDKEPTRISEQKKLGMQGL